MFENIDAVIEIIKEYDDFCINVWDLYMMDNPSQRINLKKKLVCDIESNGNIEKNIFACRELLNDHISALTFRLLTKGDIKGLSYRVKNKNSVEYKISNYCQYHENGKVPINKCINDLMGFRIVSDYVFNNDILTSHIREQGIKCIDSSKDEYRAIHTYFERDNFSFPWELQIWMKKDEASNLDSHKRYKQGYTSWEKLAKEIKN